MIIFVIIEVIFLIICGRYWEIEFVILLIVLFNWLNIFVILFILKLLVLVYVDINEIIKEIVNLNGLVSFSVVIVILVKMLIIREIILLILLKVFLNFFSRLFVNFILEEKIFDNIEFICERVELNFFMLEEIIFFIALIKLKKVGIVIEVIVDLILIIFWNFLIR